MMLPALSWLDRWLPSWTITIPSFGAAWALWHPPSNFAAYPGTFAFAAGLLPDERAWGEFILAAALCHTLGIVLRIRARDRNAARWIGFVGSLGEGMFWVSVSASNFSGNPDSLFAWAGSGIGALAFYRAFRISVSPDA